MQTARDTSAESLGRSGQRMVEQEFTWDQIVADMNRHYATVMSAVSSRQL